MNGNQDGRTDAAVAHLPAAGLVGDAAGTFGGAHKTEDGERPFAEPVLEWFGR